MSFSIDTHSDDRKVRKILLSDNKWYTLHKDSYFDVDCLEIGFHDSDYEKWFLTKEIGLSFRVQLKDGNTLMGKLSDVKAFITI